VPNTLLSDRFLEHLRRVATLAEAGIPPPRPWTELHDRYDAYRAMPLTAAQRLADAIIKPTRTDDINWLHAHALAETANPMQQANVDNAVAHAVEARLLDLYRPAAHANFEKAGTRFTDAATAFTDAANVIDPDAPATDIVGAPDDQRAAWSAAEALAAQLDATMPILTVAAELAGTHIDNEDGSLLTLCVSPIDMGRRALWEAWVTKDGRCGRWSALHRIGAHIRAANLEDAQPYRQPRDIEYRQRQIAGAPRGYYETIVVDPEEPGYQPEQPELGMIPGRMLSQ
jgi:hypothetical protein